MYKTRKQLDTTVDIVTPENIEFSYRLAGPFRRAPALLVDLCLMLVIVVIISLALLFLAWLFGQSVGGFMIGAILVTLFIVYWFYGFIFESVMNGQTPGKRLFGIRVLTTTGRPINKFQAFLRNTIRYADLLPPLVIPWLMSEMIVLFLAPSILGTVGFFVMWMNPRFQRLGDIAAGTMVVVEDMPGSRRDLVRFQHPDVLRMAEWFPPNVHVNPRLAKALALYVHRRKTLSLRRREDIAIYLAGPLQEMYGFTQSVNPDLFLCALYHRCLAKTE